MVANRDEDASDARDARADDRANGAGPHERRFRTLFERSPVGMALLDDDGTFLEVNASLCSYLGRPREQVLSTSYDDLVHPDERADALARRTTMMSSALPVTRTQRRLLGPDGRILWARVSTTRIVEDDVGLNLSAFEDLTGMRNAEANLVHAALHDPLTGLPNRRLMLDRLDHALARGRRDSTNVAVVFLDLDHVKRVNDSLGHDAGDALLAAVAGNLVGAVRETDTVARLGGDEFVVVCEEVGGVDEIELLCGRVLDAVRRPVVIGGQEVVVTASVGAVLPASYDVPPRDLLRQADMAMYRAKRSGRGRFVVADASAPPLEDRVSVESDLRAAVTSGQLELHYQPIVKVDGSLVALEALLRWEHPTKGLLRPEDFLDVVATDLAREVTGWVLDRALRDAASWGGGVAVAVNLEVDDLSLDGFADDVGRRVAEAGLEPSCLMVEVLETQLLDVDTALTQLARLSELGVGIAVDDFGTGWSSLTYLRRLPFTEVKVDQSFVSGIADSTADAAIVRAVVDACHGTGRFCVAEGVETAEQLDTLTAIGCDAVQGSFVGAPAPLEVWTDALAAGRLPLPTATRH